MLDKSFKSFHLLETTVKPLHFQTMGPLSQWRETRKKDVFPTDKLDSFECHLSSSSSELSRLPDTLGVKRILICFWCLFYLGPAGDQSSR